MIVPRWLFLVIAAWVLVFGAYRVRVALRRESDDTSKNHWQQISVFGRTKRAHLLYGILYLIMGGMLVAMFFGVQMPFSQGCRQSIESGTTTKTIPAAGVDVEAP